MASSTRAADKHVLALVAARPNLLVPHFLIHSYAYYVEDDPIISDTAFDRLVQLLAEQWAGIEHRHKALIDPTLLKTGFYLEYPAIVRYAAADLRAALRPRGRRRGN